MRIAVIPARGGSKRIPRKNIKEFGGRPIIGWSIEAALESNCFDHVIVSTDDEEIAIVARKEGAEVPFLRPSSLAQDNTATAPVIKHAIEWVTTNWSATEYACCIYATAPFVETSRIKEGFELLCKTDANFAFSVTSFGFPVQRAIIIREDRRLEMLQPEHALTRSQDLEEAYHDAGQFYWGRASAWVDELVVMGPASVPVVVPRKRVQDIDTFEDWERAELMFKILQS